MITYSIVLSWANGNAARNRMTATIETLARLPSYKNPPVDEVVCGCQFQPLGRFKLPHLGLFWEKFRREFPTTEHAPPLVSEGGFNATLLPDYRGRAHGLSMKTRAG